jgi:hypothetical protein
LPPKFLYWKYKVNYAELLITYLLNSSHCHLVVGDLLLHSYQVMHHSYLSWLGNHEMHSSAK